MKQASQALIDLLLSGAFVQADLYTITLVGGGTPIRLTTADQPVSVGTHLYVRRPYVDSDVIQRATAHWKTGLDVDTWQVAIMPLAADPLNGALFPDLIGNQPWLAAARAGALDGASVQVDRAYWASSWPVSATPIVPAQVLSAIFAGRVADVDFTRTHALLTVNSHIELLTRTMMPRNLHQSSCVHTLFDAGCNASGNMAAASFARNGVVTGVNSQSEIVAGITDPAGSGTFALGRLIFTGGANVGFSRMIKSWDATGRVMKLMSPLPFTLQDGDSFTAYPGCDKQESTCGLFSNLPNFGGEPYIPGLETGLQAPGRFASSTSSGGPGTGRF